MNYIEGRAIIELQVAVVGIAISEVVRDMCWPGALIGNGMREDAIEQSSDNANNSYHNQTPTPRDKKNSKANK